MRFGREGRKLDQEVLWTPSIFVKTAFFKMKIDVNTFLKALPWHGKKYGLPFESIKTDWKSTWPKYAVPENIVWERRNQARNEVEKRSLHHLSMLYQTIYITTLQSMVNAKLSKQRFWHFYENGLIKTIQTIPHNLQVSVKLTSLYCRLRLILVYPNPQ